ncbi:hypothetical protein RS3R6_49060 [Pseudomonas atacamensis]|uniref:Uncharacterized protein n=1 Tax=Pseudomonas atacamensis TaxID=2565368 RepID=A0ABQ5PR71_9PSED|nr:hypothetical protein RS3R1_51410 [Pseudomonas atacamensis]GLH56724.1 hypothetical protein RS3R6_49060 [Pseudomonas atacamensis]
MAGSEDPREDAVYVVVEGYLLRLSAADHKGTKVPFFVGGVWVTGIDYRCAPVGASLLAKAVCQALEILDVPDHSRASSLPQGFG